jgi:Transglutaminase-like superfamily
MSSLVLEAYGRLIQFDFYLVRGHFHSLYEKVRTYPVREIPPSTYTSEEICAAVDVACIWYWKTVLCLQRSAATACLLRCYGFRGELVIGVQQMPFKAHAWVEIEGRVVNDRPYMREMYAMLDRC